MMLLPSAVLHVDQFLRVFFPDLQQKLSPFAIIYPVQTRSVSLAAVINITLLVQLYPVVILLLFQFLSTALSACKLVK